MKKSELRELIKEELLKEIDVAGILRSDLHTLSVELKKAGHKDIEVWAMENDIKAKKLTKDVENIISILYQIK